MHKYILHPSSPNIYILQNLVVEYHTSTIYKSTKLGTVQRSFKTGIKMYILYIPIAEYNNEKQQIPATCRNMDESHRCDI